jgi:hypothetical protein
MLKLLPKTNVLEIEKRFHLIESDYPEHRIPLDRLSNLASFLLLQNAFYSEWKSTNQIPIRYADFRNSAAEEALEPNSKIQKKDSEVFSESSYD